MRYRDDYLSMSGDSNDVEIRSEYEALQPEHALIQAMIDAGKELLDVITENQYFL